ncbi:unnamed protein product [Amoebophrya sp. A120]|nr:unnamed protein product [Amoebophrya sp. A120]|eukprot:GSA120T00022679001.1
MGVSLRASVLRSGVAPSLLLTTGFGHDAVASLRYAQASLLAKHRINTLKNYQSRKVEVDYTRRDAQAEGETGLQSPPAAAAETTAPAGPGDAAAGATTPAYEEQKCAFDNALFNLSPSDQQSLLQEIGTMQADVDYVRSGGSHLCGFWNTPCNCPNGWIVFGVPHLGLWSTPPYPVPASATAATSSPVVCGSAQMQIPPAFLSQVEQSGGKNLAECHCYGQNPMGKHLQKQLNSVSLLQEAWVFLLRLLERRKLMPLGTRNVKTQGMENWSKRATEIGAPPRVPEHYFINRYMMALRNMPQLFQVLLRNVPAAATQPQQAAAISATDTTLSEKLDHLGPDQLATLQTATQEEEQSNKGKGMITTRAGGLRCGEWAEVNYALLFQHFCQDIIAFRYEPTLQGVPPHLDLHAHTLYGDILEYPKLLGPDNYLDLIVSTQVFEHLPHPEQSATALYNSLHAGGLLFLSVPQLAQYHQVPGDFFRYTKEGVHSLLSNAGFCVPKTLMASGGDYVWDIARSAGLQTSDFTQDEIDQAFQWGYDAMSDGASTIFAVAIKPPHPHPECHGFR